MQIAYCTWTDPNDQRSWSGIQYSILKTLEKYCGDVVPVGPINNKYIFWGKVLNKISNLTTKKNFTYKHTPIVSKEFSRELGKKLEKINADILFFPGGSELLAFLETDVPVVYLTDSTYESMINYYSEFSNTFQISRKLGNLIEGKAIQKASKVILASEWARESVVNDYNCPHKKTSVIPFGSNIENIPEREVILTLRKKSFSTCKMLLVGVDWERKGCQIAFDTMCKLNERGIETELVVCGCNPPGNLKHNKFISTGYLHKNIPGNTQRITSLYQDANIYIFPTRNECAGIALCEASAYGLPIITTNTGGVSDYVDNNKNGRLLPLEANADKYADVLESLLPDREKYIEYATASRDKFEKELNWDRWGLKVSKILNEMH